MKKRKWVSKGRKPFKVVHLSDVHIDRKYIVSAPLSLSSRPLLRTTDQSQRGQEGASTVCSKVICCRDYGVGSIGPNVSHPAGKVRSFALVHAGGVLLLTSVYAPSLETKMCAPYFHLLSNRI